MQEAKLRLMSFAGFTESLAVQHFESIVVSDVALVILVKSRIAQLRKTTLDVNWRLEHVAQSRVLQLEEGLEHLGLLGELNLSRNLDLHRSIRDRAHALNLHWTRHFRVLSKVLGVPRKYKSSTKVVVTNK